ncbi:MAG: hypothetical protein HDR89_04365 [Bacteroides sp.]|nr:hypothetical protein [Bacteroides sp.]
MKKIRNVSHNASHRFNETLNVSNVLPSPPFLLGAFRRALNKGMLGIFYTCFVALCLMLG